MLKVITGYIRVNSIDDMEKISEFINASDCTIEEEEEDWMLVDDIDPFAMDILLHEGFISSSEHSEIREVDRIKFYVD